MSLQLAGSVHQNGVFFGGDKFRSSLAITNNSESPKVITVAYAQLSAELDLHQTHYKQEYFSAVLKDELQSPSSPSARSASTPKDMPGDDRRPLFFLNNRKKSPDYFTVPILMSMPCKLFANLAIAAGSTEAVEYSAILPRHLPSSWSGHFSQLHFYVCFGVHSVDSSPILLEINFRFIGSEAASGFDPFCPFIFSPSDTSIRPPVGCNDSPERRASFRSATPLEAAIERDGLLIAKIALDSTTCEIGGDVCGSISFEENEKVCCFSVLLAIEQTESVNEKFTPDSEEVHSKTSTIAQQSFGTLFCQVLNFSLCIPATAVPSFFSKIGEFRYFLRVRLQPLQLESGFTLPTPPTAPIDSLFVENAKRSMASELLDCVIPIEVVACCDHRKPGIFPDRISIPYS